MFHAVYSNPVTSVPASNRMIAGPQPLPPQLPHSSGSQMMRDCPLSLNDGRTVIYCVPAKNEASLQQVSYFRTLGQRWSSASADNTAQRTAETHSTVCFASCASGANGGAGGSPVLLQPAMGLPAFVTDKQQLPSMVAQPSPTLSRLTSGLCSTSEGTTTFGASTTSVTSSTVGSGAATGTAATTNGSMSHTSTSPGLPGFQMSVSLPTSAITAVAAPPQQPQTCFWLSHTTGALTPIRKEDMMAISDTIPTYLMAPQVSSFGGAMVQAFSESLSGSTAFSGFVKRYNPNRGFGFLTATAHVTMVNDGSNSDSVTGTPIASLNATTTAVPTTREAETPKEHRTPVHLGDIFVHQSSMQMEGFRTLPVGGRVRFRIGYKDGQQTLQAVSVELLPQVLPPNVEMASSASSTQQTAAAVPNQKTESMASWSQAAPPSICAGDSSVNARRLEGCAINFASEDDGDHKDDEPLIELAYDMYASFE
ncbi:Cold-shock DNA-binding domain family protein [Leishmania donovani]|uniref:Cold-shock DNA-binding domain family protein n=1 Tax=Leishmania donovani TaxID=5661 RepID=A0A504WZZ4_LEIDO|nr:Cold-shock DNA-binding domain family protein [Leishmania donovani]